MNTNPLGSYRRQWALFKAQWWIILLIHKLLLLWSHLILF